MASSIGGDTKESNPKRVKHDAGPRQATSMTCRNIGSIHSASVGGHVTQSPASNIPNKYNTAYSIKKSTNLAFLGLCVWLSHDGGSLFVGEDSTHLAHQEGSKCGQRLLCMHVTM